MMSADNKSRHKADFTHRNIRSTTYLFPLGFMVIATVLIGLGVNVSLPLTLGLMLAGPIVLLLLNVLRQSLRSPIYALYLILLVLPFHTIVLNVLRVQVGLSALVLNLFSAWKEAALLLVLALVIGHLLIKQKKLPRGVLIPLYLFFVGWAAVFIMLGPSLLIGVYQFRNLFFGLSTLLTLYLLRPRLDNFINFVDIIAIQGVIFTGVAFYQVYLADFYAFLTRFGFVEPGTSFEQIRYGSVFNVSGQLFWRANSIFVGPNEFGLFMASLIIIIGSLLLFGRQYLGRRRTLLYALASPILFAGEFITISRNSWILIAVAGFVLFLKLKSRYRLRLAVAVVFVAIALLVFVPPFQDFVVRTLTLQDSSALGRVAELERTLPKIAEAPFGRGLGEASYKARRFDFQPIHTEYFVLMIALEVGILGLLLYLFIMSQFGLACSRRGWKFRGVQRALCWGASGLIFGTMASQFFATISLDWLFQLYLWFFVGLALWGTSSPLNRSHGLMI
jgi:O-antigen ligase